jgi:hypothetical protein
MINSLEYNVRKFKRQSHDLTLLIQAAPEQWDERIVIIENGKLVSVGGRIKPKDPPAFRKLTEEEMAAFNRGEIKNFADIEKIRKGKGSSPSSDKPTGDQSTQASIDAAQKTITSAIDDIAIDGNQFNSIWNDPKVIGIVAAISGIVSEIGSEAQGAFNGIIETFSGAINKSNTESGEFAENMKPEIASLANNAVANTQKAPENTKDSTVTGVGAGMGVIFSFVDAAKSAVGQVIGDFTQTVKTKLSEIFYNLSEMTTDAPKSETLKKMAQRIADLENELSSTKQELSENQDKLSSTQQKLAENQDKLNSVEEKLAEDEQKLEDEKQKLKSAQEKLSEDQDKLNSAQQKLLEDQEKLENQQTKLNSAQQKLSGNQDELNSLQQKLAEDQQKLEDEKQKLQSAQEKLSEDQDELNSLQQKLAEDQQKLEVEKQELKSAQEKLLEDQDKLKSEQQKFLKEQQQFEIQQTKLNEVQERSRAIERRGAESVMKEAGYGNKPSVADAYRQRSQELKQQQANKQKLEDQQKGILYRDAKGYFEVLGDQFSEQLTKTYDQKLASNINGVLSAIKFTEGDPKVKNNQLAQKISDYYNPKTIGKNDTSIQELKDKIIGEIKDQYQQDLQNTINGYVNGYKFMQGTNPPISNSKINQEVNEQIEKYLNGEKSSVQEIQDKLSKQMTKRYEKMVDDEIDRVLSQVISEYKLTFNQPKSNPATNNLRVIRAD